MGREVLCRRCGKVIGCDTIANPYRDPFLPAFKQLCENCRNAVGREFEKRFDESMGGYEPKSYWDKQDCESFKNRMLEGATSRTFHNRGSDICDRCHGAGAVDRQGLCGSCANHRKRELEEYEERVKAERRVRKTDFTDL